MQIDTGLKAYVPSILGGIPDKPDSVPDETAILFWKSQETYKKSFNMLAMRIYSLVHQPVFAFPESKADFPILFNGSLVSDQPVYLFDKPADWMNGDIKHLVAARPSKIDSNEFYTIISETLSRIQNQVSLEGAIACVGEDYLVYWELSANVTSSDDQASGISLLNEVLPNWKQNFIAESKSIPVGLWNNWNGINVHPGDCFNMKFHRREDI